ncbi:putative Ribosomal protein S10p/S20e [Leishmania shawi]|uniref:Ribosomal protein S10p/S20e n=1 Tax=Leishmania shawi TaxID=5680 RepID=A0AAW3BMD9_9TRYP
MDYPKKTQAAPAEGQTVRLTITSSQLLMRARDEKVTIHGPVRLPTRTLKITTRKTPCGNGTNTWDTFELKIYKRIIDLHAPTEQVKKITSFTMESGVDVSITILDR